MLPNHKSANLALLTSLKLSKTCGFLSRITKLPVSACGNFSMKKLKNPHTFCPPPIPQAHLKCSQTSTGSPRPDHPLETSLTSCSWCEQTGPRDHHLLEWCNRRSYQEGWCRMHSWSEVMAANTARGWLRREPLAKDQMKKIIDHLGNLL